MFMIIFPVYELVDLKQIYFGKVMELYWNCHRCKTLINIHMLPQRFQSNEHVSRVV